MNLRIVPLGNIHQKTSFHCGNELLDNYLKKQAKQDVKRKLAVCFVLVGEEQVIQGYYTLSSHSIPQSEVPEEYARRLPNSYTSIPVTLLGRLAVDRSAKGRGYGEYLLMDALKKSYEVASTAIASLAVAVDPIDEQAMAFYQKYDFMLLPDSGKMFLPMNVISKLFG